MKGRQRGKPDCEQVFCRAKKEIRERLRTCVGGQADARLCTVRAECESAPGEQGRRAYYGTEIRKCGGGQHGTGRHADERVDRVPDGIHYRYLVGEKLNQIESAGGRNYPPLTYEIQFAR